MARELQKALPDSEVKSITDTLREDRPVVNAECVGFVFPMHYFGLPIQVEEFLQKLYDSGIPIYICHSYLRGSLLGQAVQGCGKDTQRKESQPSCIMVCAASLQLHSLSGYCGRVANKYPSMAGQTQAEEYSKCHKYAGSPYHMAAVEEFLWQIP